jgi:hypothetical protein
MHHRFISLALLTNFVLTQPSPGCTAEKEPTPSAEGGGKEQKFWAFQPLVDPPVPKVKDIAWTKTALDRFVLANLEANGLKGCLQMVRTMRYEQP